MLHLELAVLHMWLHWGAGCDSEHHVSEVALHVGTRSGAPKFTSEPIRALGCIRWSPGTLA